MKAIKSHLFLIVAVVAIGFACHLKSVQMDNIHAELQAKCVDKISGKWKCD